jgi:hypothetical protein
MGDRLILVEGKDEKKFFLAFSDTKGIHNLDFRDVGGVSKFSNSLAVLLRNGEINSNTKVVGIVRDADNDPTSAFQSVCSALNKNNLSIPSKPCVFSGGNPNIIVLILPGNGRKGMLETICLDSVVNTPNMDCVKKYFECLKSKFTDFKSQNIYKANIRVFLASVKWLENGAFQNLQSAAESSPPEDADVEMIDTFLASKYKPQLDLGIAAMKGYWDFDNPAFSIIEKFLTMVSMA